MNKFATKAGADKKTLNSCNITRALQQIFPVRNDHTGKGLSPADRGRKPAGSGTITERKRRNSALNHGSLEADNGSGRYIPVVTPPVPWLQPLGTGVFFNEQGQHGVTLQRLIGDGVDLHLSIHHQLRPDR